MNFSNLVRQHWAALRALLVLTVITGLAYPLFIWVVAQFPGLHDKADGSIIDVDGKPVGSRLIGQSVHRQGRQPAAAVLPEPAVGGRRRLRPAGDQREQPRPGEHRRHPRRSAAGAGKPADAGFKPSLLTQVCTRSVAVGKLEGVDGSRPFCTGDGVGAVLSVIGPRDPAATSSIPPRWSASTSRARRPPAPFLEHATRACGSSAPSTARTTRSARSCPSAAPHRPTRLCPPMRSPPAAAGSTRISHRPTPISRSPGWPRPAASAPDRYVRSSRQPARSRPRLLRRAAGQRARAQPGTRPQVPGEELIDRWMMVEQ